MTATAVTSAPPARKGPGVRDLPPNLFAIAMATGIVSLAANGAGMPALGRALFWLNLALYPTLWALLLVRCARHRDRVAADLHSHGRAPGFFATVASDDARGESV